MSEESKAVVKTKDTAARIYEGLTTPDDPFEVRRQAYEIASEAAKQQMVAKMQRQVAAKTWGKALPDPALQQAFCEWALSKGIDPALHVEILGGNVYLNAQYYLDKLVAHPGYKHSRTKVIAPVSQRKFPEEIFDEKAQEQLMKHERKVNIERYKLQIDLEVPPMINNYPDTAAAMLVEIEMADGRVFEGWGKAGSYGRKSPTSGKGIDPVGDSAPVETATTRAYRKACKKIPGWSDYIGDRDAELATVEEAVEEARQRRKEREKMTEEEIERIETIADMQVQIDDLLAREEGVDPEVQKACATIYEDWIAGGFQNITIDQVHQLLNELVQATDYAKAVEAVENGLCPECNASIDMGEPHGDDCERGKIKKFGEGCDNP